MQLSNKKTYSSKDCVNKGTLQHGKTKASSGSIQELLVTALVWGLLQGLRVWVGGLGEVANMRKTVRGCPETEKNPTEGVARLALRGRQELSLSYVLNCQVITVDLHLKDGAVERKILCFYSSLTALVSVLFTHFLSASFFCFVPLLDFELIIKLGKENLIHHYPLF